MSETMTDGEVECIKQRLLTDFPNATAQEVASWLWIIDRLLRTRHLELGFRPKKTK